MLRQPAGVVLVADDHAPLREGVRLLLERAGYRVVEAATADEAVEVAEEEAPVVCLIDLGMPGGGLAAVERIYASDPHAKLIVLTGSTDERDVFSAVRAGAIGYLVKGVDDDALLQAVEAAVAGEPALPRRLLMLLMGLSTNETGRVVRLANGGHVTLTPRETQVLAYLKNGLRTREIAEQLALSPVTVRRHISALLHKLDAPTRQAAIAALDANPTDPRSST